MSVMEISHRSKTFDEIIGGAEAGLRGLYEYSRNYHVLFLQAARVVCILDDTDELPAGRRER